MIVRFRLFYFICLYQNKIAKAIKKHYLCSRNKIIAEMKSTKIIILISMLLLSAPTVIGNEKDKSFDNQCKTERKIFLNNMPSDLQQKQKEAILKAIDGDSKDLQVARTGRNSVATISENVIAEEISATARLYKPKKTDKKLPILIYLHGGGWTIGSINSCSAYCNALASTEEVIVLAINYRLAPEFPFPFAIEDCINAYLLALEKAEAWGGDPSKISIGGDSSGGNLALATALQIKRDKLPKIKSLILFYPVVKAYADKSSSWKKYGKKYGLNSDIMIAFNNAYTMGRNIAYDPLISIYHAGENELKELPKILFVAAGKDILFDQGKAFCKKVTGLGVKVERDEFSESCHLFITVKGQPTAFNKSVELTKQFLCK